RQLTTVALLAATALFCLTTLLLIRRFVRHLHEREALASAVAHDLRTPLTQILLYAETLQLDRPAHRTRADAARVIVRETRRLIHLVENALSFTRGKGADAPQLRKVRVFPAVIVRDVLTSFRPMLERGAIRVGTAIDESACIMADEHALAQILGNVIDNALRFGPPGQNLRITVTSREAHVRLEVDDEGPGVPPRLRHSVFRAFVRGHRNSGTGIGLAVARQLTEMMDGRIEMEASPSGGARVRIDFPAVRDNAMPARGNERLEATLA
ncbi:MAG: HAMP domain-containing sensor histidine kinase, partial [Gemmatimonadota bacterium]